ncbi:MAG: thioesterase [Microbacteriaceae bacterium]|jgi:acyl-CoA thioesterase FadM|nr:thioesterase [Microbacteriaceae bacterium]
MFRTILLFLRRRPPIGFTDVGTLTLRVMPTDIDFAGHMNNGFYLSVMDLGRIDLLIRSGVWAKIRKAGISPVMANATITFRRSLQPWQRYTIESRMIGYDEKAVYCEQRMVVDGQIWAQSTQRARFVRRNGRPVPIAEVIQVSGIDISALPVAPWIERWAADVALPPARGEAPSEWA